MGFGQVIANIGKALVKRTNMPRSKISPSEWELNRYLEKERQDQIKKTLHQYKLREQQRMWAGRREDSLMQEQTILKGRNTLLTSNTRHNILGSGKRRHEDYL